MISRRNFMKIGLGLSTLSSTGLAFKVKAMADPETSVRFLVVFLRGAYDAISIVVPRNCDFYYEQRPNIAIAAPDPSNIKSALALDGDWGLHPALTNSLYPFWQAGEMAFVPFAGTDDLSRSHFETQNTIELGQPLRDRRDYNSGFMGRLAHVLGADTHPISFTQDIPMIFRGGSTPVPNLAVNSIGKPAFDARQEALIESMYQGTEAASIAPLVGVQTGFAVRQQSYGTLKDEMMMANRGAITAKGLALQAQRMAEIMNHGYNLAFLDVGGWDTHVNQGNSEGQLASKITDLGQALASFAKASGSNWKRTTLVVISEFGRTFRENGDRGTDHGHGSIYWVMGGNIRGGLMAGPQLKMTPETLLQKRDLPVLTDYRGLIGGLVQRLYGLNSQAMMRIFPSVTPINLNLV